MEEKIIEKILELIKDWGIWAVLIMLIVLILQNPERIEKIKLHIIKPFFSMFRWFARSFITRTINVNVTEFINKDLLLLLDSSLAKKVRIKLNILSTKEEIQLKKNKIIIRLKEDDDQTKNILTAANLAIPMVVCPLIRTNIDRKLGKAIDLTVLKKLADKLGSHARFVYKKNFFDPELIEDPTINELIQKLIRIDKKGFFISIFANELNYIGEGLFARSDISNRTAEVIDFLNFLIAIAERGVGSSQELVFRSNGFGVGILLLAKTDRAVSEGLTPYLHRIRKNIYYGCESIYIVSFPPAWGFLKDLLSTVKGDRRYNIVNTYNLKDNQNINGEQTKIALLRPNKLFTDQSLDTHLKEQGIGVGSVIEGIVTDVSVENAVVKFWGLNGYIRKSETSWYSNVSCSNELNLNETYNFIIKNIDYSLGNIELSRKFDENDPWKNTSIPNVGDVIEVVPQDESDFFIYCLSDNGLEVKLPKNEFVWGEILQSDILNIIGKKIKVLVLLVQTNQRLIRVSLKQLSPNPWEEINERFPKGKSLTGKVVEIHENHVSVEIEKDIIGRVPRESFYVAGYEYKDFNKNLVNVSSG